MVVKPRVEEDEEEESEEGKNTADFTEGGKIGGKKLRPDEKQG